MDKTVCELFAGVGGFHLGLDRLGSGWKVVWYNQWEPGKPRYKQFAHACYARHFGVRTDIHGAVRTDNDIHTIDKSSIPDHTLLVAGYPCQDFSVARPAASAKGIEGAKGALWWQVRDTIEAKRPAFCIFENVDRMIKSPASQRGRDFGIMLSCLNSLGYDVEWRVINSADYGAVQRRRRVFIFAYRKDTLYAKEMTVLSCEDVMLKRGLMARAFPIMDISKPLISIRIPHAIQKLRDEFSFGFCDIGRMVDGEITTSISRLVPLPDVPLRSVLQKDVPSRYYITDPDVAARLGYLKRAKKFDRTSKSGHKYTYSEGNMAFPDPVDRPSRTILTLEGSMTRSSHVIRDPDTNMLRFLTPVEVERLNGFDDDWTECMPERMRYFCMGNALVVPMITRMGKVLDQLPDLSQTS